MTQKHLPAKFAATLCAATLLICSALPVKAVDLLSLGSNGFTIQGSEGPYTQTATSLSFATVSLGATVFGEVVGGPLNWSSAPAFGVRMTVTSGFEPIQFSRALYDTTFDPNDPGAGGFANYIGNTSSLTANVEGTVSLTLDTGSVNTASIIGMGVSWDGVGAANSTMAAVAAVPEPSTYVLLGLGAFAVGAYRMRRRP